MTEDGYLHGAFDDRHQTWDFVRSFAAAYSEPLRPGDGVEAARLDAVEARLGLVLPAALREAYLLFGARDDLTRWQDRLLPPDELHVDDAREALVFRRENQGCTSWGVRLWDLGRDRDDPPTVVQDRGRWAPFTDRLSILAAEMVLLEAMFSKDPARGLYDTTEFDWDEQGSLLESRYEPLGLPGIPQWSAPDGRPIRWYQGPDVLIREDGGGTWLWVHGRTPAAVDAVRAALPASWQLVPD
ncbi:hypothetical protein KGQ19_12420 [Catenulispora sp. NL8]|uniref:Knr4/Smi1-like domain-containing protein n=1 Tax=Catenulispora pinistramenti TaxID=2705254 RepID=A0ABS5KNQ4_9ACTN|nr:hypothetical protein [Catenulispora pinistramenti]MBS2547677.1 hypothetical protein [Catenulispora pinistramenti]